MLILYPWSLLTSTITIPIALICCTGEVQAHSHQCCSWGGAGLWRSQGQLICQLQVTRSKRGEQLSWPIPPDNRLGAGPAFWCSCPLEGSLCCPAERWGLLSTVPPVALQTRDICMAFGDNMDLGTTMQTPAAIGPRPRQNPQQQLGPGCSHDLRWLYRWTQNSMYSCSNIDLRYPHGLRCQRRPQTSARPLVLTRTRDTDTDPSCSRITDPDMALGHILGPHHGFLTSVCSSLLLSLHSVWTSQFRFLFCLSTLYSTFPHLHYTLAHHHGTCSRHLGVFLPAAPGHWC